jgi:plastocyanin
MKRALHAAILLGGLALAGCHGTEEPKPNLVEVFTPGNTFSPFSANLAVGGVVRFNIFGEEHNVIFTPATPGAPEDVKVVRDVVVERTFTRAGDYPYTCTVHPGMNGEIIVR